MIPGIATKWCFFSTLPKQYGERHSWQNYRYPTKKTTTWSKEELQISPLPLVPLDNIEDVWFRALNNNVADLTDPTKIFTDYVTEQWVNGDRLLWNHFDIGGPRTNNTVWKNGKEGWRDGTTGSPQNLHTHGDFKGHPECERHSSQDPDAYRKISRRHHRPHDIHRYRIRTFTNRMKINELQWIKQWSLVN